MIVSLRCTFLCFFVLFRLFCFLFVRLICFILGEGVVGGRSVCVCVCVCACVRACACVCARESLFWLCFVFRFAMGYVLLFGEIAHKRAHYYYYYYYYYYISVMSFWRKWAAIRCTITAGITMARLLRFKAFQSVPSALQLKPFKRSALRMRWRKQDVLVISTARQAAKYA